MASFGLLCGRRMYLERTQQQSQVLIEMGFEALETGHPESATRLFDDAVRLNPKSRIARIKAISIRITRGELKEADERLENALRVFPNDKYLLDLKGDALMKMGRAREAVDAYRRVVALRPSGYWSPWLKLGVALEHCGQYEEAKAVYQEVLGHYPGYTDAQKRLSNLTREGAQ